MKKVIVFLAVMFVTAGASRGIAKPAVPAFPTTTEASNPEPIGAARVKCLELARLVLVACVPVQVEIGGAGRGPLHSGLSDQLFDF